MNRLPCGRVTIPQFFSLPDVRIIIPAITLPAPMIIPAGISHQVPEIFEIACSDAIMQGERLITATTRYPTLIGFPARGTEGGVSSPAAPFPGPPPGPASARPSRQTMSRRLSSPAHFSRTLQSILFQNGGPAPDEAPHQSRHLPDTLPASPLTIPTLPGRFWCPRGPTSRPVPGTIPDRVPSGSTMQSRHGCGINAKGAQEAVKRWDWGMSMIHHDKYNAADGFYDTPPREGGDSSHEKALTISVLNSRLNHFQQV